MTGGRGFGTECPTLCASLGLKSVVDGQSGRGNLRGVHKIKKTGQTSFPYFMDNAVQGTESVQHSCAHPPSPTTEPPADAVRRIIAFCRDENVGA